MTNLKDICVYCGYREDYCICHAEAEGERDYLSEAHAYEEEELLRMSETEDTEDES